MQSTSKRGVRLEQLDMDMAKQALQGVKVAIARMKDAIAEGSLKDVHTARQNAASSAVAAPADPAATAATSAAERQRKLTDLTNALLPSDWRCASCSYLNSFSNGPCSWCGNAKAVAAMPADQAPSLESFRLRRKRAARPGVPAAVVSVTTEGLGDDNPRNRKRNRNPR